MERLVEQSRCAAISLRGACRVRGIHLAWRARHNSRAMKKKHIH
jgi:hypothetical protein